MQSVIYWGSPKIVLLQRSSTNFRAANSEIGWSDRDVRELEPLDRERMSYLAICLRLACEPPQVSARSACILTAFGTVRPWPLIYRPSAICCGTAR